MLINHCSQLDGKSLHEWEIIAEAEKHGIIVPKQATAPVIISNDNEVSKQPVVLKKAALAQQLYKAEVSSGLIKAVDDIIAMAEACKKEK